MYVGVCTLRGSLRGSTRLCYFIEHPKGKHSRLTMLQSNESFDCKEGGRDTSSSRTSSRRSRSSLMVLL